MWGSSSLLLLCRHSLALSVTAPDLGYICPTQKTVCVTYVQFFFWISIHFSKAVKMKEKNLNIVFTIEKVFEQNSFFFCPLVREILFIYLIYLFNFFIVVDFVIH